MFNKKVVLIKFAIFKGKHLCWSLLLIQKYLFCGKVDYNVCDTRSPVSVHIYIHHIKGYVVHFNPFHATRLSVPRERKDFFDNGFEMLTDLTLSGPQGFYRSKAVIFPNITTFGM